MKYQYIFIIFGILGLSLISCSDSGSSVQNTTNTQLKYFGFAVTDCGYIENPLEKIDSFVNLIDMCLFDFESIQSRLIANTQGDNRAIIHLGGLFIEFVDDPSSPTTVRAKLSENYESLFETWYQNNKDIPLDKISAFTIVDEPAWNNMDMEELAKAAKLVKAKFPNTPIMLIEAADAVSQLEITSDIDWVGFDRYGTLDPNTQEEYLIPHQELKKKMKYEHQKIVVIMESQWLQYYTDSGYEPSVLIPMAKNYYEFARSQKDIVALISYALPSKFDSPDQKGFFDLDKETQDTIQKIGSQIVNQ